jgi:DNA polymerase elongation subunit (family B)
MYSNVYFAKNKSLIHCWEYNEAGEKVHKTAPAPLYFFVQKEGGEFKTIFGDEAKRVDCTQFGEYREKIENYKSMEMSLFESDVPIETKFIVNEYLGQELKVPKFNIHYIDIEVHSDEGFPKPEDANFPIVIITIWSTKHNKFFVFTEKDFDTTPMEKEHKEEFVKYVYPKESDLLKAFVTFIYEEHPDIISGWFSNAFDIPYIINRIKKILGEKWAKRLSPLGIIKEREFNVSPTKVEKRYEIAGISLLDMLEVYQNYTFSDRENYKLGYITKLELGDGFTKKEYAGSIADFYTQDWQGYAEYNIQDTRLLRLLEDKLGYIKLLITFCYGCRIPFDFYQKTTKILDGAFIAELTKEGIVLPDVNRALIDSTYPGGFVKEPIRGIHDWVISFDATSLYPSIMMGWNISPETKTAVFNKRTIENLVKALEGGRYDEEDITYRGKVMTVKDFIDHVLHVEIKTINKEDGGFHTIINGDIVENVNRCMNGKSYENLTFKWNDTDIDVETASARIKSENLCLATNGVVYSQNAKGVIPRFVETWFNDRNKYKKLMLKAENEKDDDAAKYYHLLQLNFKILINSVYGYLGTVHSRFYDFDNAVAVTITGQSIIKECGNSCEKYFSKWADTDLGKRYNAKNVDKFVIYNDTDSSYFSFGKLFDAIGYDYKSKTPEIVKNYIMFGKELTNLEVFGTEVEKKQVGGIPKEERKKLEEESKSVQNLVASFIDKLMVRFTKSLNCVQNKIFFKREAIAARAIFLEPKKYVYWVLNSEGVEMNKIKSVGVEMVRSSTPLLVQKHLKNIVFDILKKMDSAHTEQQIRDFRSIFMKASPEQIAFPKTVNNLDEYRTQIAAGTAKSIPIHVRASLVFNNIINSNPKLKTTYDLIYDADKMKFVYMKTNSAWQENVLGFKDKWPKELGLDEHVDYFAQFDKTFLGPLQRFYALLNWQLPNLENENVSALFDW